MKIQIDITKARFFALLGAILLLGAGVFVYAFNADATGGEPAVMGHSVDEIDWSEPIYKDVQFNDMMIGGSQRWIINSRDESGRLGGTSFDILLSAASTNWTIRGFGDANLDQKQDIYWQSVNLGTIAVWNMDNTTKIGTSTLAGGFSNSQGIMRVGDIDNDGDDDFAWLMTDNRVEVGTSSGGSVSKAYLKDDSGNEASLASGSWYFAAMADMDGDNDLDMIFQKKGPQLNPVEIWYLQGGKKTSAGQVGSVNESLWYLGAVADLSQNDNRPDFIFHKRIAPYPLAIWYLDNSLSKDSRMLTGSGPYIGDGGYVLRGASDMNRDGVKDLIWQGIGSNLKLAYWYMSGKKVDATEEAPADANLWFAPVTSDGSWSWSKGVYITPNGDVCSKGVNKCLSGQTPA